MDVVFFMPRWQVELIYAWLVAPQLLGIVIGTRGAGWTAIGIRNRLFAACVGVVWLFVPNWVLFYLADYLGYYWPAMNWLFLLALNPLIGAATAYIITRWTVRALGRAPSAVT
jgi:hypothetical protein